MSTTMLKKANQELKRYQALSVRRCYARPHRNSSCGHQVFCLVGKPDVCARKGEASGIL